MKRIILVVALALAAAAVSTSVALGSSNGAFAAGGGKAGDLKFQVSAHTDANGVLGAANGQVGLRNATLDVRLDVVCVNVDASGTSAFIETQDPSTGLYWDVSVHDGGPGGNGDLLYHDGPYDTPICPPGGAVGDPVTSGNIVVNAGG